MKFTYMIFSWFMIFKNTYFIKFYPQLQFGQHATLLQVGFYYKMNRS